MKKIKYTKTYMINGQIDIIDEYEIIVDKKRFDKYCEDNDIDESLASLLQDLQPINFTKSYFNKSVSFKAVKLNIIDDNYGNTNKELIDEEIKIL